MERACRATGCRKIGVVGLGYVGLPLAIAFARKFAVVGFDVSAHRIATLRAHTITPAKFLAEDLAASSLVDRRGRRARRLPGDHRHGAHPGR
jgi:UDP-N-acetyl-D-mannosaminuronate dehydrogenase